MKILSGYVRVALLALVMIGGSRAFAQSTCSSGFQDSTCLTRLVHGTIAPPTCSTAAGWTTTSSATWIGSGYTSPQCNYQAPPSCPSGYTETSAPVWTGSSWTAPGCAAPPPPVPQGWTSGGLLGACESAISGVAPSGTWQGYQPLSGNSPGGWSVQFNDVPQYFYWTAYGPSGTYTPIQYDTYFEMFNPGGSSNGLLVPANGYVVEGMIYLGGASARVYQCAVTSGGSVEAVNWATPNESGGCTVGMGCGGNSGQ